VDDQFRQNLIIIVITVRIQHCDGDSFQSFVVVPKNGVHRIFKKKEFFYASPKNVHRKGQ
jgi:hypothetical protein